MATDEFFKRIVEAEVMADGAPDERPAGTAARHAQRRHVADEAEVQADEIESEAAEQEVYREPMALEEGTRIPRRWLARLAGLLGLCVVVALVMIAVRSGGSPSDGRGAVRVEIVPFPVAPAHVGRASRRELRRASKRRPRGTGNHSTRRESTVTVEPAATAVPAAPTRSTEGGTSAREGFGFEDAGR
jgi:hypothetical protein